MLCGGLALNSQTRFVCVSLCYVRHMLREIDSCEDTQRCIRPYCFQNRIILFLGGNGNEKKIEIILHSVFVLTHVNVCLECLNVYTKNVIRNTKYKQLELHAKDERNFIYDTTKLTIRLLIEV